jgi:hypothetical protein
LRFYWHQYPAVRTYILDTKGGDDFRGFRGILETDDVPAPIMAPGGQQVWRPAGLDVASRTDRGKFDEWFGNILQQRKPALVLVNEIASIGGSTGRSYPANFSRLLKLGRSLEICMVVETQEAAGIPRQVLGQMTHLVRFNLRNDYDRRITGAFLFEKREDWSNNPPKPYGFYYRRVDIEAPTFEYRTYKDFFD